MLWPAGVLASFLGDDPPVELTWLAAGLLFALFVLVWGELRWHTRRKVRHASERLRDDVRRDRLP
jgi:hypothetical protein